MEFAYLGKFTEACKDCVCVCWGVEVGVGMYVYNSSDTLHQKLPDKRVFRFCSVWG